MYMYIYVYEHIYIYIFDYIYMYQFTFIIQCQLVSMQIAAKIHVFFPQKNGISSSGKLMLMESWCFARVGAASPLGWSNFETAL